MLKINIMNLNETKKKQFNHFHQTTPAEKWISSNTDVTFTSKNWGSSPVTLSLGSGNWYFVLKMFKGTFDEISKNGV